MREPGIRPGERTPNPMYKNAFISGLAAMAIATSSGCCGPCGGCADLCSWYPGKHLHNMFASCGCGGESWGGCGCESGCATGGCDVGCGCNSCGGGVGVSGEVGTSYYNGHVAPAPAPPARPTSARKNLPGRSVQQAAYRPGKPAPPTAAPCNCQNCQKKRAAR